MGRRSASFPPPTRPRSLRGPSPSPRAQARAGACGGAKPERGRSRRPRGRGPGLSREAGLAQPHAAPPPRPRLGSREPAPSAAHGPRDPPADFPLLWQRGAASSPPSSGVISADPLTSRPRLHASGGARAFATSPGPRSRRSRGFGGGGFARPVPGSGSGRPPARGPPRRGGGRGSGPSRPGESPRGLAWPRAPAPSRREA